MSERAAAATGGTTAVRPQWRSGSWWLAGGLLAGILVVVSALGVDSIETTRVTAAITVVVAAGVIVWAGLRTRRQRLTHEASLTAWATERAQREERLRIARELHDLASHGLGLITVRASVARVLTGADADAERERALADIESAGRAATTELRRMLSMLRSPETLDFPSMEPAAGLSDLSDLVTAAERTGLRVTWETSAAADADPGTLATIVAIVREALANVARHAGPTTVRVTVRRERPAGVEVLVLRIADDGPVPGWHPHPGAGHGVAGMRERVAVLGGSLRIERTGSGHLVEACMPLGATG